MIKYKKLTHFQAVNKSVDKPIGSGTKIEQGKFETYNLDQSEIF